MQTNTTPEALSADDLADLRADQCIAMLQQPQAPAPVAPPDLRGLLNSVAIHLDAAREGETDEDVLASLDECRGRVDRYIDALDAAPPAPSVDVEAIRREAREEGRKETAAHFRHVGLLIHTEAEVAQIREEGRKEGYRAAIKDADRIADGPLWYRHPSPLWGKALNEYRVAIRALIDQPAPSGETQATSEPRPRTVTYPDGSTRTDPGEPVQRIAQGRQQEAQGNE